MIGLLREKLLEVLQAFGPLFLLICVLQTTIVHAPAALFLQFIAGSALAFIGMWLLFLGIDLGIVPMGRYIGAELPKKGSIVLIISAAFAIGFVTTMPEPDVLVLATQVDAASNGTISGTVVHYVIALGMAAFAAIAMARIVFGWPMNYVLAASFLLMIGLAIFAPPQYVPLAFDGGSVTTGALSGPTVIAVAIGVSLVLAGRSAVSDGFGLAGFASIGPIIAILLMGLLFA